MDHMTHDELRGTALEWGIKDTLVSYVRGMKDGSVTVSAPAREIGGAFWFPATPAASAAGNSTLKFSGSVALSGHGGMLKLIFEDPWLVPGNLPTDPWTLTINDPYEPGARLAFATIARLTRHPDGSATASETWLTSDGADLFFSGPYTAGTDLDDPRVVARG